MLNRARSWLNAPVLAALQEREAELREVAGELYAIYQKLRLLETRSHIRQNGGTHGSRLEVKSDQLDQLLRERKGLR